MTTGREILPTHELNKSPIGPLWLGRILDADGELDSCAVEDLCLVRRLSQAKSDDAKAGLEAAVAAAQNLDHPNILPLLECVASDKELWLASQYVAGENLRSLMRLSGIGRKPAPEAVALKLVADILEALSYLHASQGREEGLAFSPGPDRIWLTGDGNALLMTPGFGVLLAKEEPWARIAKRACYDAPETFGESPVYDIRSDVFVAGVLLWELLRNRQLFSGSSYSAVQQRVTSGAIRRVDSLKPSGGVATSKAVADIVARAVARDPEARFASPAEMLAEIREQAVADAAEVADYCNGLLADLLKKQARRVEQATAGAPVSSRRGRMLAGTRKAVSTGVSAAGKKSKESAAGELLNAPDSFGEQTVKVGRKADSESSILSVDGGPSSGDDWDESTLKVRSKLQLASDGDQPPSADGWDESTLKVAKSESADEPQSEGEKDEEDAQNWDESTLQVQEQAAPDASSASEPQADGDEGNESTAEDATAEAKDAADEEKASPDVSEASAATSAAAALMSPAATGAADYDMLSIADDPSIEEELPEVARRALAAVAEGGKDDGKTNLLPIVLVLLLVGAVFMAMRGGGAESGPAVSGSASAGSVPPNAGTVKSSPSGTAAPAAPKTAAAAPSAGKEAQASPSASAANVAASAEPEASASAAEKKVPPSKTSKAPVKVRMPKRRRRPRVRPKPRKRSDFTPSDI